MTWQEVSLIIALMVSAVLTLLILRLAPQAVAPDVKQDLESIKAQLKICAAELTVEKLEKRVETLETRSQVSKLAR